MFTNFKSAGRFDLLLHFTVWFIFSSLLLRIAFLLLEYQDVSLVLPDLIQTLLTGLFYDLGTVSFIILPASFYYMIMPSRWVGSLADTVIILFFTALSIFILVLTFFAEIIFWGEFKSKFNFIAVDYLIYTHEVLANIQESYPLPILIGSMLLITGLFIFIFLKRGALTNTLSVSASPLSRFVLFSLLLSISVIFTCFVRNDMAEWSANRYNSEISKSGIYSFVAAFRNNQMEYKQFYSSIDDDKAFALVRSKLQGSGNSGGKTMRSVSRKIIDSCGQEEQRKNVVFILVESFSAGFMKEFGNKENITPFLDSLAQESIFFSDMYATGTRTVRGMEAVTLCIPPTPGQSIVKRPENSDLFTIGSVFRKKKYATNFFYGGDGYFDNMNAFFGGNGFTIYDRGRGSVLSDKIKTVRNNIEDKEVTFENAWGICDGDIYSKMLKTADLHYSKKELFFNFVMTTSNHRPYTYPDNTIDIPSGTGRNGAVKYTDYALREFFRKAKEKPWFKNTIFVVIADHCASSAGKDEIDIANYHIPAFIVNMPEDQNRKVLKQCSQIDFFPTLFSLMHWNYNSIFFGNDILNSNYEQRALVGTYRKLTLMKKNKVVILSDQKKQSAYLWDKKDNSLSPVDIDQNMLEETIAWYQTADYLFTNKLLH
ncbi:sulfatase [Flavobacterium aquidurense]|uniref:LTA synthase family protein n=1 Tax=Flavobacterium aquidurense TaxID=362413 RepID=UPI00091D0FB1|nr:LTA synthase family protein [Flavobacterium aquidurense]OXA69055.1 sulfatase [Flavobacterium aquidurense]SHH86115.1 Phosphoglycerol transferase MdoB [Flavobacterium frigidimaris]